MVAECAALPDNTATEQIVATAGESVRDGAIDAWIANCPVMLPDVITIGIKAMVEASGSRCRELTHAPRGDLPNP